MPANDFDNLLNDATSGVNKFDSKQIHVKDVSEEFLDTEARLKTKKELEVRFLDLLKQAKSVTEILEIEKQIGELRSNVESAEGRMKYLESRISLSTLTLTLMKTIQMRPNLDKNFKMALEMDGTT